MYSRLCQYIRSCMHTNQYSHLQLKVWKSVCHCCIPMDACEMRKRKMIGHWIAWLHSEHPCTNTTQQQKFHIFFPLNAKQFLDMLFYTVVHFHSLQCNSRTIWHHSRTPSLSSKKKSNFTNKILHFPNYSKQQQKNTEEKTVGNILSYLKCVLPGIRGGMGMK